MKKTHKNLFIALLLSLTLAGCGGGGKPNSSFSSSSSSTSSQSSSSVSSETSNSSNSSSASIVSSSSSSSSISSISSEPVQNTVYLNLGPYGLFNGVAGRAYPELSLEYGYAYTALVGSTLPKQEVTSSQGNEFLYWVLPSTSGGTLRQVEVVPANHNVILEAWWDEGTIGGGGGGGGEQEEDRQFIASAYDSETKYYATKGFSTLLNTDEWSLTATLEAGYEFKFYSTQNLYNYDSNVYPSMLSGKGDVGYTLSADSANGNYTADYLDAPNSNAGGVSGDGATWCSYTTNPLASLKVKEAGTYTFYITLFDNGGWLQIYTVKA